MWYVVVHGYYNKNYLKTLVNRFHPEYISHDLLRHITQHINCVITQDILKKRHAILKRTLKILWLENVIIFGRERKLKRLLKQLWGVIL